ncbi:hypothetical protein ACTFIZ_005823 [Dictyostelium cf. discoideum]
MKILLFVFFITFLSSLSFGETLEKEQCEFIKNQNLLQPISIFISYNNNNNNARIDFLKLENNSKSFQVFQSNKNRINGAEFLSITSNSSILVKSNNEYTEQLQWGKSSLKSFSFKWDNELYQPYYTIDQCSSKNTSNLNSTSSFDLSLGKLTAMVVSGSGNFSILNGNIQPNENPFEFQSHIKVTNNDLKYFKSSFDIENNIHYSLIYDKNNNSNNNSNNINNNNNNNNNSSIYLIITNFNNVNLLNDSTKPITTTISINIPDMELKSMGISGNNNTIIIAGFDNKSNSTKFYSVNILNNKINHNNTINNTTTFNNSTNHENNYNNNNILQSNLTLLFEKNITISNFVKSLNSKYLMIYSADLKLVSVYNIIDNSFYSYSNLQISVPNGYSMVEIFSSGLNESIIKSTTIDSNKINNGSEGIKNKIKNKQTTIIIVSAIIVACILGLIGGAIFLIVKKRKSRVSFKRLDKDRETHKYPQDNITILLQNYK